MRCQKLFVASQSIRWPSSEIQKHKNINISVQKMSIQKYLFQYRKGFPIRKHETVVREETRKVSSSVDEVNKQILRHKPSSSKGNRSHNWQKVT